MSTSSNAPAFVGGKSGGAPFEMPAENSQKTRILNNNVEVGEKESIKIVEDLFKERVIGVDGDEVFGSASIQSSSVIFFFLFSPCEFPIGGPNPFNYSRFCNSEFYCAPVLDL